MDRSPIDLPPSLHYELAKLVDDQSIQSETFGFQISQRVIVIGGYLFRYFLACYSLIWIKTEYLKRVSSSIFLLAMRTLARRVFLILWTV